MFSSAGMDLHRIRRRVYAALSARLLSDALMPVTIAQGEYGSAAKTFGQG